MAILRSLLYSPGNRPKMIEKAATFGADALIFDLEDTVPTDQKAEARAITREYVQKLGGEHVIYVRVNAAETGLLDDDLEEVVVPGLHAVSLPKVDAPEQVRKLDAALTWLEEARFLPPGSVGLSVSLETARGVYLAYEICSASPRVVSASIGSAQDGDLQADLGFIWTPDGLEQLYARSRVVLAARAAGVELPLDGVYANFRDPAGFAAECRMVRQLGYRGKKLIHPSQVEPANRIFAPTQQEIDYYRRVLEAFEAALAQGSASTSVDGKLVDYAMVLTARNVLGWAESLAGR